MRISVILLAVTLPLASCGEPSKPSDDLSAAEAVAMVEGAQIIPAQAVTPQTISFPDLERENLFGASCSFVPDGAEDMVALAMKDSGAIKLKGELLRLAPDAGSPKLPYDVHQKYDGLGHSMELALEPRPSEGGGEKSGIETTDYGARLTLRDASGQVIYAGDGTAQCGV